MQSWKNSVLNNGNNSGMNNHWNVTRRQAQGERFLSMAGAADVGAARALWKDPALLFTDDVSQREQLVCLENMGPVG
jgi:hypothetical protein